MIRAHTSAARIAMSATTATVHIDGAARGNPGPAAWAFVISYPDGRVEERSESLGTATNNVAEYNALVEALDHAHQLGLRRLDVFSDSELLVNQINGEYRVKNPDLKQLYDEARALMGQFDSVRVSHVRREFNDRADELCNIQLDGKTKAAKSHGKAATSAKTRQSAGVNLRERVDEDAVASLRGAARAWQSGAASPTPEQMWDQLWSILEEAGVLKSKRGGR
jgi:ribonuclease HI